MVCSKGILFPEPQSPVCPFLQCGLIFHNTVVQRWMNEWGLFVFTLYLKKMLGPVLRSFLRENEAEGGWAEFQY